MERSIKLLQGRRSGNKLQRRRSCRRQSSFQTRRSDAASEGREPSWKQELVNERSICGGQKIERPSAACFYKIRAAEERRRGDGHGPAAEAGGGPSYQPVFTSAGLALF